MFDIRTAWVLAAAFAVLWLNTSINLLLVGGWREVPTVVASTVIFAILGRDLWRTISRHSR